MRAPKIKKINPSAAVEGGKITIEGSGFDPEEAATLQVSFNGIPARPFLVAKNRIVTPVPDQAISGPLTVIIKDKTSNPYPFVIGQKLASSINPVDSPVFDLEGNLYTTYSGKRGEEVAVSVFKIDPQGNLNPFLSNIPNATSLAFDSEGNLYVSSRFEGIVYKANRSADVTVFAKDLGAPTGLAFDQKGVLYVGDRNGRILRVSNTGEVSTYAEIPESMVAFHIALDLEGNLLVTNPGTSSHNSILLIDRFGKVIQLCNGLGRPQGLTVDDAGNIYVCEAKAGESSIYKISTQGEMSPVVSGPVMVVLAFDRNRNLAVATQDSIYVVPNL